MVVLVLLAVAPPLTPETLEMPESEAPIPDPKWEFPKIRGTFLGVPIIRPIVFWGLYWGPPILGTYQILLLILEKATEGDSTLRRLHSPGA